jgi:hypothetical protein
MTVTYADRAQGREVVEVDFAGVRSHGLKRGKNTNVHHERACPQKKKKGGKPESGAYHVRIR